MTRQEIVIAIVLSFDTFRAPGNKLLDLPSVTLLLLREFYNVPFFLSFFPSSFLSFFAIIVINPPVRAKPQIGVSLFLYLCRDTTRAPPFARVSLDFRENYIYTVKPVRGFFRAQMWHEYNRIATKPWQKARPIHVQRYRFPSPFCHE